MFDKSQAANVIGQNLFTSDGDKVGKIGQVYVDDYHDQPEWVTVNTGMFGTNESFVPLAEASLVDGGVSVPYTKTVIKDAPNIAESGHLSEAEEQELYKHYNVPFTTEGSTFADTSLGGQAATTGTDSTSTTGVASTGYEAGRSETTDDAMTRSEERLNVGTETVQTGQARLRKWVETENVQVNVPIRTEKAVLVTEGITQENAGQAFDGPGISEEEHVVTLNAEKPVVAVETVPVERVRLDKQVEETTQTVGQDVRKERIALEDDTTTGVDPVDSDRR